MLLILGRSIKEGLTKFWRNTWLSLATLSILALSLYVLSLIIMLIFTANLLLKNIEDKTSISVYFKPDIEESVILGSKTELEKFSEIKSIEYISKEKALETFKRDNANEPTILQSLETVGGNPLLASLVIKANNPNQYQIINNSVQKADFYQNVSKINYGRNKEVIDRLNSIVDTIKKVGLGLGILLGVISILITFNSIRISIYATRQEIEVMRLVGASNTYIRLPFVFEGIIYGILASIFSMLALLLSVKLVSPYIEKFIVSATPMSIYVSEFWTILGFNLILGIFLGVFSSLIAMRKYMKV